MQYAVQDPSVAHSRAVGQVLGWRIASAIMGCLAVGIVLALVVLRHDALLLSTAVLALGIIALLHARFLHLSRSRFLATSQSLETRESEFRSVFDGAIDAILILDDQMICREANSSSSRFLGVGREQLVGRSISVFETDRAELSAAWKRLLAGGRERGQLEMMRSDGVKVAAEFIATSNMLPGRHLLVLHDATQRLQAEDLKSHSLRLAKSAVQEASALRSATLALTQSVRLNPVLDKLFETLHSLIPYQTAQVLLLETSTRLFLAREFSYDAAAHSTPRCADTVDSVNFPALQHALERPEGVLVRDTRFTADWRDFCSGERVGSWLGVPLCARDRAMGLLSVMHPRPGHFTAEHLRLAGSLAIPATLAIENARLYERAEICSAELEKLLADVRRMEQAFPQRDAGQGQSGTN